MNIHLTTLHNAIMGNNIGYHLLAIATMVVWGSTFASTKTLILHGLAPSQIFFLRFSLAWLCMSLFTHESLWAHNVKDEMRCAGLGISGGSLYFLTENTALSIDLTSNVSLIVCIAPLLTTLLVYLVHREKVFSRWVVAGTVVAIIGVTLVVFNGSFILKISPVGALLAFSAALTWAVYSLQIQVLEKAYSIAFITRKVFFYGVVTILPVIAFEPHGIDWPVLLQVQVWGNLLFLGVVASMVCFLTWNICLKHLGTVLCSNYIYLSPLIAFVFAVVILHEHITWISLLGCAMILSGLYFTDKK